MFIIIIIFFVCMLIAFCLSFISKLILFFLVNLWCMECKGKGEDVVSGNTALGRTGIKCDRVSR